MGTAGGAARSPMILLILVIGITCSLTLNWDSSSAPSRPTQSSIFSLYICAFLVWLLRLRPFNLNPTFTSTSIFTSTFTSIFNSKAVSSPSVLPLHVRHVRHVSQFSRDLFKDLANDAKPLTPRALTFLVLTAAIALCFRIELFRIILGNTQCTISGAEGCVPFFLAIYDYCYIQGRRDATGNNLRPALLRIITHGQARYLLPAAILSGATIYTSMNTDALRSTYICPLFASARRLVPVLQFLAALADCYCLLSIETVARRRTTNADISSHLAPMLICSTFVLSATLLSFGGLIAFVINIGYWKWVLGIDKAYIYDLIWKTILFTILTLCALEMYTIYGLLHLSLIITFVYTYASGFASDLLNQDAFVPFTATSSLFSSVVLVLGAAIYFYVCSTDILLTFKPTQRLIPRIPSSPYTVLILLLIGRGLYQLPQTNVINVHPIDRLVRDAATQSKEWLLQASTSKNFAEAVETYHLRYKKPPPPGFDAWYKYATQKSSLVIDDYDGIYEDLRPFWALSPESIRAKTRNILSDQWNEVAEVSIRSGKAKFGPKVIPTHRWMLNGVLSLMQGFVQWLPDMDLAFNINDEPRVAIPWKSLERLQEYRTDVRSAPENLSNVWSSDRAQKWRRLGDKETPQRPFRDRPRTNSFTDYGSIACPPSSPARKLHLWDPRHFCTFCAAPHSDGIFLKNWTLSASPCHQPDLAYLHGFYLSPAAFKPSYTLFPVFSQSKAQGYADILYPSAWNYIDKVKYEPSHTHPDPPFTSKENSLFWRGATSEGLSRYAAWKGMARQRLVHLANNATRPLPILLPHPSQPTSYAYTLLRPSALDLNLDVAFVDNITRCWDDDCDNQAAEFGLANKSDFQAHWRHRFLIDLDGAGFSGRFLPFMYSRSLIFKTAVFREWWDGRVFAWRHFVPVDVRFHGLLSTLAYFAGTERAPRPGVAAENARTGDERGGLKANVEAGREIAEAGREWASRVLRKEDMEIYMFRLLLEWGRLTDDRRDELGFTAPS